MSFASDTLPNFTGCTLDKRYELTKLLGSGTYGVVYKAIDHSAKPESDSRFCAVKIIKKKGRSPTEVETVRREVTLHGFVSDHPNVVTLHDCIEDEKYFYIILEYIPGGDLFSQICDKQAYINDDELLRSAFLSLVDAVEACHDAKIAHRDIKPENVLTTADGSKVFLADFGLATTKRMVEEHGVGTSIYMAPECVDSGSGTYCTRSADIWALGMIFVNMISSRNPWQKAVLKDKGFALYVEDHDFLYDTMPISEAAHTILQRIFTINPLRRITLSKLRRAIENVDTFFRPTEDIEEAIPTKTRTLSNKATEFDTLAEELGLHYQARASTTSYVESTTTTPELSPSCSRSTSQDSDMESSGAITPPEGLDAPKSVVVPKDLEMAQERLNALILL
ncbi:kinase-like protein [Polyporus arcularius HHB13444]|uniref:Kinase-like protein n=1 Tax=Polyporus arcularius HHB13444 TaxID=1314778 RepID=A0A5C3PN11_9APHY|nr:kinase-like protein [Polyporus arcularius HHB13444]